MKKLLIPGVVLGVFLVGLLAFGSYDPRHELSTLVPNVALATLDSGLEAPELDAPELSDPAELDSPELDSPELDAPELEAPELDSPELEDSSGDGVFRSCDVTADASLIATGGSVTISWETTGFDQFYLNGESVSGPDGSRTFTNVQSDTTYTLLAKTDDGSHKCTTSVTVQCVPEEPPKQCTDFGFDFTVAKFGWNGWNYTKEYEKNGHDVTVSGDTNVANWTADPAVAGVIAKAGTSYGQFSGGESGTVKKWHIGNGQKAISHILFCGKTVQPTPECTLTPASQTINEGERATLSWTTTNADTVTLTDFGSVSLNGSTETDPLFADTSYTLTASGYGKEVQCQAYVDVKKKEVPAPSCDSFTIDPSEIDEDEIATLDWETSNATRVVINQGVGEVAEDGSTTVAPLSDITYTLTAFGTDGREDTCHVTLKVNEDEDTVPACTVFGADRTSLPASGGTVVLNWETINADDVSIAPGVGAVDTSGTTSVTVTEDTTYTLTASDLDGDTDDCTVIIDVEEEQNTVPACTVFGADRTSLPASGGTVLLNWETKNADDVSIAPTVGAVGGSGTTSVEVSSDTVYTLTASDLDGDSDSCTVTIDVDEEEPSPISCEQNVSFSASDTSIDEGDEIVLSWNTTGLSSLSISNVGGIGTSGSVEVSPDEDINYVLTGTDGTDTVNCPLFINVDEDNGGGGGGGSASPRCELEVSDDRIERGEEITIEWDTSRATEVTLYDDERDEIIFTTDDLLARDKEDFYDGELTLAPTRDTRYRLLAERGSREDECEVEVEVDDDVTVIEDRFQEPLIAGISLSQTPYTGFEAGPILTFIFYALLVAWALFVAYVLVIKRDSIAGFSLATANGVEAAEAEKESPRVDPNLFPDYSDHGQVGSVTASTPVADAPRRQDLADAPGNLPTGTPVMGYQSVASTPEAVTAFDELEDLAHSHRVLLSSDALRRFAEEYPESETQVTHMEALIDAAKRSFPAEDGWVVVNKGRMETLMGQIAGNTGTPARQPEVATEPVTVPQGSSSLAEAIVTGNVMAAYQMIGNRPMFALADAAADLDAAYRKRTGEDVRISELLEKETADLSAEQLKGVISALTSALDGVYTSEEEAVKVAIIKAVKAVA